MRSSPCNMKYLLIPLLLGACTVSAFATSTTPPKEGVTANASASSSASTAPINIRVDNTVVTKASNKTRVGVKAAGGSGGNGGGSSQGSASGGAYGPSPYGIGFIASPQYVTHDYSGMPNNTPAMGNTSIFTSNTCDGATSLGGVGPGVGVTFSTTFLRMMCEGRLNAQVHNTIGSPDKAKMTMSVVDEYACTQDATWARIARAKGLCVSEDSPPTLAPASPPAPSVLSTQAG